ncbi:2TM domain-containing protein [Maribacter algarum]|uniref:2TM domain-containing protein n=1 Tax=Maribacter algarum (ex Zhang et al. 2020) TaxID=2578118 RepID=A0A5S3PQ42_9FLAO|nr:2TM domain-containing protein [Maribacter algarum]TMM56867.1 2TM domain-containing protein [Maribacter algarum]
MESKNTPHVSSYERAQKKVKDIKGFYGHLAVYVIVILVVLSTRGRFMSIHNTIFQDSEYLNWIDWNVFGTPIIWGIFLIMHGIRVFGKNPFLGRKWEDRQIQKYMEKKT